MTNNIERKLGYKSAKSCFDYSFDTGKFCPGSSPYVFYVESVAFSLKNGEKISPERIKSLDSLIEISPENEFNKGVHDFLIEKINEISKKRRVVTKDKV
jgi:hypothetical protein